MKVYFSNRIENLFAQLAQMMACPAQPDNPLAPAYLSPTYLSPEYVLIDNKVMGEWLNLQLAETHDIAANIEYLQPSGLFWKLAKWMLGNALPHETPLLKDEMKWRLFTLLADGDLLQQPGMRPVRDYLFSEEGPSGEDRLPGHDYSELKRFQLANSIADLFDQYLIYRPQWLRDWQQGKPASIKGKPANDDNEHWQAELWRRLVDSATVDGQCWHRAAIEQCLLEIFHNDVDGVVTNKVPVKRLLVFGITSMYPSLVKLLEGLSGHIDVTLFVLNPCSEYWGLVKSAREQARQQTEDGEELYIEMGNPLLASQGVQVKEFIELLCEHDIDDSLFADSNAEPKTLLQSIQQEIQRLEYRGQSAQGLDYVVEGQQQVLPEVNDGNHVPSVHIHQCHSPQREVEVLHDQVRDMLARNPEWRPRDIVVMMPRVASYVPYIHAVFNSVPEGHRIPYHITDRTLLEESPLLNSFMTLLNVAKSRLPLSEILSLLEVDAIQQRFGLDQSGFELLRHWLVQSGVRWGLDAGQRAELGLPAYDEYSWQFGINRLLAGVGWSVEDALSGEALLDVADGYAVMPFDEVEGGNINLLDSFLQFWDRLLAFRTTVLRSRTVGEWYEDLLQVVHDFYAPMEDDDIRALNALRTAIEELQQVGNKAWCTLPLGIEVIRDLLKPALEQTVHGRHHWQEGIKFCSLLPMRAVPFKAVYIMGMNQADYPRQIIHKSFDLMRHQHIAGDRASRIDDRWLFLEALLSAREVFHVSYIARDMHRNEKREPSVVLAELLDYLKHGYALPDDWLHTCHPLQPFSPMYFTQGGEHSHRLFSFDAQAFAVASAKQQQLEKSPARWSRNTQHAEQMLEVSLNEFVKFFVQPWNWFLSYLHGVDIEIEGDGVEDDEPFAIDNGLERWSMRNALLVKVNAQAKGREDFETLLKEFIAVCQGSAQWPVGQAGQAEKDGLEAEVDFIYASHGKTVINKTVMYQCQVGKVQLLVRGELPVCEMPEGGQLLVHTASNATTNKKLRGDRLLEMLLKSALAIQGDNAVQSAQFIWRDKTCDITEDMVPVAEFLPLLATLYVEYRHCGLPFDVAIARDMVDNIDDIASRYEVIDSYWYGDWMPGAAANMKKRIYFGAIESIREKQFADVCRQIQVFLDVFDEVLEPKKNKGKEA